MEIIVTKCLKIYAKIRRKWEWTQQSETPGLYNCPQLLTKLVGLGLPAACHSFIHHFSPYGTQIGVRLNNNCRPVPCHR